LDTQGSPDSTDFRIFFNQQGVLVSPWHDIPLFAGKGIYNFVCEIPKETSAKMEAATKEPRTPIKQDIKKGKLRFYPYNINWNYGFIPQTWEDPAHKDAECDAFGDNDPVDVVEVGSATCEMGGVYPVKAVGAYAMIDEGELDWKVICIRADDPKASQINDIEDVEK
jgi:inorganic pyrophosphatase